MSISENDLQLNIDRKRKTKKKTKKRKEKKIVWMSDKRMKCIKLYIKTGKFL